MKSLVFLWDFPLILEAVKEYKGEYYRILIVDRFERMPETILDRKLLDEVFEEVVVVEDINNRMEVLDVLIGIQKRMKIKAIYATFEEAVEMAGFLREKLKVSGMQEAESIRVRNKYIMKNHLRSYGIKLAKIKIVKNISQIREDISEIGYPLIFKPLDGAGAAETFRIKDDKDLTDLEEYIEKKLKDKFCEGKFVVEEFIQGEEYHCDSIVMNGEVQFVAVGKYLNNCLDAVEEELAIGTIVFPMETGDFSDSINKIKKLNKKVINALAIQNSICHMEVFVQNNGDVIFSEIATRVGGGPLIGNCIINTYGIDIYKAFVQAELGEYNQTIQERGNIYTGCIAFPTKEGKVTKISISEDFINTEGVVKVEIFNKVGDYIHAQDNTGDRTGYIIMEANDYLTLKQMLISQTEKFELCVQEEDN